MVQHMVILPWIGCPEM